MSIDFKDHGKKPYVVNIEDATLQNENYRTTIWTGEKLQPGFPPTHNYAGGVIPSAS